MVYKTFKVKSALFILSKSIKICDQTLIYIISIPFYPLSLFIVIPTAKALFLRTLEANISRFKPVEAILRRSNMDKD